MDDRKGSIMVTEMARVPKDAQRSIFFEGKQKMRFFSVGLVAASKRVSYFLKIVKIVVSARVGLYVAGTQTALEFPKILFFLLFEKYRLFPSKFHADRLCNLKTQFLSPGRSLRKFARMRFLHRNRVGVL